MASAVAATTESDRLLKLVGRLEQHEGFSEVVASLRAGHAAALDGVWGSSCALVAAALARAALGPLVVVCPRLDDIDERSGDTGRCWARKAAAGIRHGNGRMFVHDRRGHGRCPGGKRPVAGVDSRADEVDLPSGQKTIRPRCRRCHGIDGPRLRDRTV